MHRHQYKGRKLSRESAQRKALLKNLTSQVILYERVTTTLPKAKEVRPMIERLITYAKEDTVFNRRKVAKFLSVRDNSLKKLFEQLGPLYKERNGGYLRIIKIGNRKGDNAEMAQIQLLDTENLTKESIKAKKEDTAKSKTKKSQAEPKKKKSASKADPGEKK